MRPLLLIILFSTLISCSYSVYEKQNVSTETRKAINTLSQQPWNHCQYLTKYRNIDNETQMIYDRLKESVTMSELEILIKNSKPKIRETAFMMMFNFPEQIDLFSIAQNLIDDKEMTRMNFGHSKSSFPIGEIMIWDLIASQVLTESENQQLAKLTGFTKPLNLPPKNECN